ncbi:MAG: AAA family ATPase, partial [Lachnospiraceae bacterium]|nr:AAA family ATPase [Lachnospiraceae bacterium]
MARTVAIGLQSFEEIRENNYFYIDKTNIIKEWWESGDAVTLITRPRRFGKTLNMDTLNCFFSNQYAGRGDLFEGLSIWEKEKYRQLQGTYPVIFVSFASIKDKSFEDAKFSMVELFLDLYKRYPYVETDEMLVQAKKTVIRQVGEGKPITVENTVLTHAM